MSDLPRPDAEPVAVLGTGIMDSAMARNLAGAGLPTTVMGPFAVGDGITSRGLPMRPFEYDGVTYSFGQANNALVYPGQGLGTIVSRAAMVTDGRLHAAAEAVAGELDVSEPGAALLPAVQNLRASSATSAVAVANAAAADSVATAKPGNLVQAVEDAMWQPVYMNGAGR